MGVESKVEYLIVDTSAFIKNAALQDIGNKIITETGVVKEIKNKRQLRRLIVLPYDLEVKEAYPEDIKFVTEFSKKTGDYPSLSATDIKVIALTYRYEKERVGTSHLKSEPDKKKEIVDSSIHKPGDKSKSLVGFYTPDGDENCGDLSEENKNLEINTNNEIEVEVLDAGKRITKDIEIKSRTTSNCSNFSDIKSESLEIDNNECDTIDTESDDDTVASTQDKNEVDNLNKKFEKLQCNPEDLKLDCEDGLTVDDILKPVKKEVTSSECQETDKGKKEEENCDENDDGDDDDDDDDDIDDNDEDGWITPKNIIDMKNQMDSNVVKEKPATVACLTMDYAMQNVMIQIGLNVASIEGKCIKQMRTFILRCYTCFKTTGIITKVFCPHCGNKTLKKVAVSLDDEGNQQIHINFRKPLTSKGKKFSLPTFQGGKHACNPILFEDQRLPDQRPTKLGRATNDPLNDDYIAGYSPFVMRDVNSKAAQLGIRPGSTVKHWMKRNPNEPRKHKK